MMGTIKGFGAHSLADLRVRLQLLGLELNEEKSPLTRVVMARLSSYFLLTITLAIYCWQSALVKKFKFFTVAAQARRL
ncbi:MAG: hypothetical protein ACK5NY_03000 [Burkholderiaceae bacterium]|jgi:hypothetical protein